MEASVSPHPTHSQERLIAPPISEQSQEPDHNAASKSIIAYGAAIGCLAGGALVLTIGPSGKYTAYPLCGMSLGTGIGATLGAAGAMISRYLRSLVGSSANCWAHLLPVFFGSDKDGEDSSRRSSDPQI